MVGLDGNTEIMKNKTKGAKVAETSGMVSFRLSPEILGRLEKFAATQQNDLGKKLSVSSAARRLTISALNDLESKKK